MGFAVKRHLDGVRGEWQIGGGKQVSADVSGKKKQHIATLHSVCGAGGGSKVLPQQNSVLYIQLIAISHFSEFSLITVTRIKT